MATKVYVSSFFFPFNWQWIIYDEQKSNCDDWPRSWKLHGQDWLEISRRKSWKESRNISTDDKAWLKTRIISRAYCQELFHFLCFKLPLHARCSFHVTKSRNLKKNVRRQAYFRELYTFIMKSVALHYKPKLHLLNVNRIADVMALLSIIVASNLISSLLSRLIRTLLCLSFCEI